MTMLYPYVSVSVCACVCDPAKMVHHSKILSGKLIHKDVLIYDNTICVCVSVCVTQKKWSIIAKYLLKQCTQNILTYLIKEISCPICN